MNATRMVGVDLDNTIVCYDSVFFQVTQNLGILNQTGVSSKKQIRDFLRNSGREEQWIEIQGAVYGKYMDQAAPFEGVMEFLRVCKRNDIPVRIISHRTRHPFKGPAHDLHESARRWIEKHQISNAAITGISKSDVYLEATNEDKIRRIIDCRCNVFIDDLSEFLIQPNFPRGVERILFDPLNLSLNEEYLTRMGSWSQISAWIMDRDWSR